MNEGLHAAVTPIPHAPMRVAIAAQPHLLADSLGRLLRDAADITLLLEDSVRRFDVLLTTEAGPRAPAGLVIELDQRPDSCGGGRVVAGEAVGELADLQAVLGAVRAYRAA